MIHQVVTAPKQMPVEKGIAFAQAHQLGYEIPGFVETEFLDAAETLVPKWRQDLAGISNILTLHGPVFDLNPVSLDPQIADVSKYRYLQATNICKSLGCRYLVVHSQFSTIFEAAKIQQEWLSASIDFWQQFAAEQLEDTPTLGIVIENFMENDPALLRQLIDGINHPQVKACLDTGHTNIFSKASVIQWLDELESQLVYIHSHNNHGRYDEHRGYNYGTIDMEAFLNHLMMLPYKINLALEIFNEPELVESYKMVERYLSIQQEQLPEKTFLI